MDNRKTDAILMVICAEAPGCFEIDPESGEPLERCVYSKLIQLGYTSDSPASAGEKDATSINFFTDRSTRITSAISPSTKCIPNV